MFDTPGSFLAAIRQNKNRRHVAQLFGSVYLSAGGSILVSGVVPRSSFAFLKVAGFESLNFDYCWPGLTDR